MASRPLIVATLLGASVGVPYLASQSQHAPTTPSSMGATPISSQSQPWSWNRTSAMPVASVQPLPASGVMRLPSTATATEGAQFTSVGQVLRFDVTKEWVCQNWSRKSTGPTDVGLFAMRVPLVMGTQMSALAGALTYYFNDQGQVEHISFRGRTGDATPLVQLLTQTYRFQAVPPPAGERVFEVRDEDGLHSELKLRPEAVLNSATPQQSVVVELEFARPGSPRLLPPHDATLQIPQAAGPPTAETAQASGNGSSGTMSAVKSAAGGYFDQVRYATPDEYGLLRSKRWPQ